MTQPIPEAATSRPVQVRPEPGSRLEQLHAAYPAAKAEADEAAARLKAITDGIKLELGQAAPEQQRVDLLGDADRPALRLAYSERVTFDSKKLKAEDPETYVRYAKFGGAWSLRAIGSNQGGGE